jgi:hypothetical protein
LLLSTGLSQNYPTINESERIQNFRKLGGPDQVHALLRGTSWFQRAFTTDFQDEERILVTSRDSAINGALAQELKRGDVGVAREAVFVICERARFVHPDEFPIKYSPTACFLASQNGMVSPFYPDFDKVGKDARDSVRDALHSPDGQLRSTAKIYCGELEQELKLLPPGEVAARWRDEIRKLHDPLFAEIDSSEEGELVRVLRRVLASQGLEAAAAMSELLDKETKPWARELEIEMIEFLDGAAVRLRGSQRGREVIQVVEKTLSNKELKWTRTKEQRLRYWKTLEKAFFEDEYSQGGTARDHWATLIGMAFDQRYGERVCVGTDHRRPSFLRIKEFIAYLTETDPTFPSWEFPSTLSEADMLHPKFSAKLARYHEAWVLMNTRPGKSPAEAGHALPGRTGIPGFSLGAATGSH